MQRFAQRDVAWTSYGVGWLAMTTVAMLATGCILYAIPREALAEVPPWEGEMRHWCVIAHGVGAWLFCVLAGRWLWPHVPIAWRRMMFQPHWWLGLLSIAWLAALLATGLLLLYGSEGVQAVASVVHWWAGVAWPVPILAHLLVRI